MSLREFKSAFWIVGAKAQIAYLSEHKFSGEVKYWFDNGELRRELKSVFTGEIDANGAKSASVAKFLPTIEEWLSHSDAPIKIMFRGGEIKRIET